MSTAITRFRDEYSFLSNFYQFDPPIKVTYNKKDSIGSGTLITDNVEAAFQAGKSKDPSEFTGVTPNNARYVGRHSRLSKDEWNKWLTVRLTLMERLIFLKFDDKHPELQKLLLSTGDSELIEGNTWNDTFWGVCKGVGQNNLGKILMKVRQILRTK